jgi:cytochrome c oxidase subunit 4
MMFDVRPKTARPRPFVLFWVLLLVLAGISLSTAFLGLGLWAPVIQFGIAAMQASIVFIVFMRLKGPPSLKWVFAASGFFWLLFLYGLTMTDYASRQGWPSATVGTQSSSHPRQP